MARYGIAMALNSHDKSSLTYYKVATRWATKKDIPNFTMGLDNYKWVWNNNYSFGGYPVASRVGSGVATWRPGDDWWWKTEPLVKSAIRMSAGFIYHYQQENDLKGDWQSAFWPGAQSITNPW